MSEPLTIACPHCHTLNRVPAARVYEAPACGRCHRPLFAGKPVELDAQTFAAHAERSSLPLLVDFWAPWCGACRMMAPQFEAATGQVEPKARLAKIDTEAQPALAARFGIDEVPSLVVVEDRRVQGRLMHPRGCRDIETMLSPWLH